MSLLLLLLYRNASTNTDMIILLLGGQYAVVYLGGYGKSAQIYTKDTGIFIVIHLFGYCLVIVC